MNKWLGGGFLLILAVGLATAESEGNPQEGKREGRSLRGDPRQLAYANYEAALRPATLEKRSIANIARLLLGGNVPPNHPLVRYNQPKNWNLASNIVAALPAASSLAAAASNINGLDGSPWINEQPSAMEQIQQLFETKSKIIPYTGQVATGLTGLASTKGDLLRQFHSISTQAIAQAAAEAAARALAGAAAAHAVTNSLAHSKPAEQYRGWGSNIQQNVYQKTPGDYPGPPYHHHSSSSAHINHYQAPPSQYNPYHQQQTTPAPIAQPTLPSPVAPGQSSNNPYLSLYNSLTQQQQGGYTPAPPAGPARPTLSPNTLIATTPSVPAGIFGRHAAHSSPAHPSLLTTLSNLFAASTAAYNAVFASPPPLQQRPGGASGTSALLSALLSAASSPDEAIYTSAGSSINPLPATPSVHSPSTGSYNSVPNFFNSVSQTSGNYGSGAGSLSPNPFYQNPSSALSSISRFDPQTYASPSNPPNYNGNGNAQGYSGHYYAQPGANPYYAQSVQFPQFGGGPYQTKSSGGGASAAGGGIYATQAGGHGGASPYSGPGYSGYPSGAGPSSGHVSRWDTQSPGQSSSASQWSSSGGGGSSSNGYSSGYTSQASGNFNYSPGTYGSPVPNQTPSGSSLPQQNYPSLPSYSYQSSETDGFAQSQQSNRRPSSSTSSSSSSAIKTSPNSRFDEDTSGLITTITTSSKGAGRFGNSHLRNKFKIKEDNGRQSATLELEDDSSGLSSEMISGNYQQNNKGRRTNQNQHKSSVNNKYSYSSSSSNSRQKHPSSEKRRPTSSSYKKQPYKNYYKDSHSSKSSTSSSSSSHRHEGSWRKGENGNKRVIPLGNKKGDFKASSSASVDVVAVVDVDQYRFGGSTNGGNDGRWRTPNSSGQRPHPIHNQHSGGGRGQADERHDSNEASAENVSRTGGRPASIQPGRGEGNSGGKGGDIRGAEEDLYDVVLGRTKAAAAEIYRERLESREQPKHESRGGGRRPGGVGAYTTLPEYVWREEASPTQEKFSRGGGTSKRKHGGSRGKHGELLQEKVGSGSSTNRYSKEKEGRHRPNNNEKQFEKYDKTSISSEKGRRKWRGSWEEQSKSAEALEESHELEFKRTLPQTTSRGREKEIPLGVGEASDETARADVNVDSHFISSEEFDPEEREAFVDDVYADDNHRRHDYQSNEEEGVDNEEENEDVKEVKKK